MFQIVSFPFSSKPQQPKEDFNKQDSVDHQHPVQDVTQIPTPN